MIINRKLMPNEETLVFQLLMKKFVIIALGKEVKMQIDRIISRIATISVTFNGTEVYMYKLLSSIPVRSGRYPILIKGYAGSGISYDVLGDAIKVLGFEARG